MGLRRSLPEWRSSAGTSVATRPPGFGWERGPSRSLLRRALDVVGSNLGPNGLPPLEVERETTARNITNLNNKVLRAAIARS
jgi:hypothetical protein